MVHASLWAVQEIFDDTISQFSEISNSRQSGRGDSVEGRKALRRGGDSRLAAGARGGGARWRGGGARPRRRGGGGAPGGPPGARGSGARWRGRVRTGRVESCATAHRLHRRRGRRERGRRWPAGRRNDARG